MPINNENHEICRVPGDHARLSSTTGSTIMSDYSDNMEFSPTRPTQVATCEKLRDTVTGISTLHMSLHEFTGRSPSPKNSFTELYRMSTEAMIKRKEEMASKESTEEFIFSKKTARPVSPTSTQNPIETNNNFSELEQDVEHPLPTANQVTTEVVTPKITLPHPIMLKIKKNFREQIKCISEKFSNIRNRIANDVIKIFTNDHEEYRNLIHLLESDKDFEFYVIKRKIEKPIKAVIKGLPSSSKIEDVTKDLADEGYVIDSCMQLISKRTKKAHPYFLVILPRNGNNSKIFDIAHELLTADDSCTPIGPPLLKSRPPLQAKVTNTKNIASPDRGLRVAGAA
ncbi:uncharacterized protein TNCV_811791 [Trichonephila clavipes]|nr:uncharacterized protein TNCV_811791 [Trichonephila clavipes]